jgi:hypothetical protein
MVRAGLALLALAVLTTTVSAQPRGGRPVAPPPPQPPIPLPLSPGVMPGSPWGPGAPFAPSRPSPPPPPGKRNAPQSAFPAFEFGPGEPFFDGYFYPFSFYRYGDEYERALWVPAPAVGAAPARSAEPLPILANEFPATLSLQFPAAAEVWLNGKKVDGAPSEEQVLKSPVLTAGGTFTFDVRARWTTKDKTYETKRTLALSSGQRSRLIVVSGEEVK